MKRVLTVGAVVAGFILGAAGVRAQNRSPVDVRRESGVWGAEELYRRAKLANDIPAMNIVLNEQFVETNQNGNSRDKSQTLDLWRTFPISSLTTDTAQVRFAGSSIAVVDGTQTEQNGTGTDRMIFTRVWILNGGSWELLSSTQYRDPRAGGSTRRTVLREVR